MATNIAATAMSQAIGAASSSVRVANLLGSFAIMVFLLFGGFLLNKDQVSCPVPSHCSTQMLEATLCTVVHTALHASPALWVIAAWFVMSLLYCWSFWCTAHHVQQ